jgi:hypothetical protein
MILLPSARAAYLRSFSIILALLNGLFVYVLSHWLNLGVLFSFVVVLAVGFPLLGLVRPKIMLKSYRLWNLSANYFARVARLFLMGICFYIILLAVGRAGTSMSLARPRPDESLWLSKKTLSPDTYAYEFAASGKHFPEKGWLRSYLCWARVSGHVWAMFLVPLLAMLSAVEIYRDRRFPAGVYTLF